MRLPDADEPDEEIRTVVQPDLVVLCDMSKLDERGCRGAPDMVVEILSPSTSAKDQRQKLALYERHGVREYWIVDSEDRLVRIYRLGDGRRYWRDSVYPAGAGIAVGILPDLVIDTAAVFGAAPVRDTAGRRPPPRSR